MEQRTREVQADGSRPLARGGWPLALLRALWAPGLIFLLHLFLCGGIDYYASYRLTDELMHLAGGFAIAFAAGRSIEELRARGVVPDPGRLLRVLLVVSLTALAAVLWELAEFLSDRYLGTRTLGDLEDTLLDLALGIGGALLYLLLARPHRPAVQPMNRAG